MSVAEQRTRRRQQREETRAQILEAAQNFLRERSFRELSVDALMARTGHSRTVFYRHFDDVPSLVLTLISEIGSEIVALAEGWAQAGRADATEARQRLATIVDFYVRYGVLVRAVMEAAHHDVEVEAAYHQMIDAFIAMTADAIAERAAEGKVDAPDPEQLARALVRMLNGYLNDTLGGDPQVDPARVLDTITTVWTRTLFPGEHA